MSAPSEFTLPDIAGLIDHALLAPTLTPADFDAGCDLAAAHAVATVCVSPHGVRRCADRLAGTGVGVGTVIGFPLGGHASRVKRFEAEAALADGATELDTVVNVGRVRAGDWGYVADDLAAVLAPARDAGAWVKVIFETCYLGDDQKARLCELSAAAGADWVKTSTGFGSAGATPDDVRLMRSHTPPSVGVKASGGVRTLDDVLLYRGLGCTRVGCSGTAQILTEARRRLGMEPLGELGAGEVSGAY